MHFDQDMGVNRIYVRELHIWWGHFSPFKYIRWNDRNGC